MIDYNKIIYIIRREFIPYNIKNNNIINLEIRFSDGNTSFYIEEFNPKSQAKINGMIHNILENNNYIRTINDSIENGNYNYNGIDIECKIAWEKYEREI